ncbi:hypothetical protein A3C59_01060 [Candidatus Daviesbacteria bacterium RIFCSPHIGHO2_02_FULL_36_13]|uniref:Peptidase family M49 n=1 Tax=Candidatus Daviesbacteria bacterium RIFCSPHIGHO2_02_FULL_36_13 TaxID=1797768 RepID=A0A1F5JYI3_9BACT|nr:MAG: hypothetical protein A3C59_01060 [Candidatus Daviesbacteria bacterium RIFCSPHIGHO2_02_FULL_36_13]
MKKPLILFYPKNLPLLSKNELEVLDLLMDAGKLIAPLYLEQEKQAELEINKGELERAAKKNPAILDPHTVVEKVNGKIVVTPYHIKYAKLLKPVADKLIEASKLTKNKDFGNILKLQAKALTSGAYEEEAVAWLKIKKPYILDTFIGPIEHFGGQLLFGKASYQAWVGVLDKEGTDRLNNYKSVILSVRRKATLPDERVDNQDQVKARVLDVVLFSGFMARAKFVGLHLPTDVSLVEKYGSELILFNQPNDLRIKEQIIPTFNKIFSKEFKEGFEAEDIRRGYLRAVALHELAHSYLYYKHAARNLADLFPVIEELAATILGLRLAGTLLLKDRINNKQLESMIVTFLCRSFYHKGNADSSSPLKNYALGGNIFINFIVQNGALKISGGQVVPNFMKIFVSLHELSDSLEYLLEKGSYKDAQNFIKKYS